MSVVLQNPKVRNFYDHLKTLEGRRYYPAGTADRYLKVAAKQLEQPPRKPPTPAPRQLEEAIVTELIAADRPLRFGEIVNRLNAKFMATEGSIAQRLKRLTLQGRITRSGPRAHFLYTAGGERG